MKKLLVLVVAVAFVSLAAVQAATADPSNVTCSGLFTGTADTLTVPADTFCFLEGATINRDVTVQTSAALFANNTTVGRDLTAQTNAQLITNNTTVVRDLTATKPNVILFGYNGSPSGPVRVGRDLKISGSDAPNGSFIDVCDTTVGRDLLITDSVTAEEIQVGDNGEFCASSPSPPDTIGRDAIITGNTVGTDGFGFVDVGNNSVGRNLVVSGNTAPGFIDVSDNTVGRDANCSANTPLLSKDGPDDGQNSAGRNNTCG